MNILIDFKQFEEELRECPIEALAAFVLSEEQLPSNTELSISFVDEEEMAALNEQYRGKEGPTDVLSFECDSLEDDFPVFDGAEGQDGVFTLGDVIISPALARRQGDIFGHGFSAEVSLLLVHGILHLCSYDHIEEEEAQLMEARERELLGKWADKGHEQVRGIRDDTLRLRGQH